MSYSQYFFGKKLHEITEQDLLKYFAEPKEETDQIEFKSGIDPLTKKRTKLDVILKSITAFLNSSGGLLIWGAPHDTINQDRKEYSGALVPLSDFDRDKIIGGSIANTIEPLPSGIRTHPVGVNGGIVVIFDIPSSDYKPHRFKHVFYMRMDGSTHKAPYHFVEALFKRVNYAETRGFVEITPTEYHTSRGINKVAMDLKVIISNESLFRNDQDVFFTLYMNGNLIIDSSTNALVKVPRILHYGLPCTYTKTQSFTGGELHTLELLFGGRYSPLKKSVYTFEITVWSKGTEVTYDRQFHQVAENIRADEWDTI